MLLDSANEQFDLMLSEHVMAKFNAPVSSTARSSASMRSFASQASRSNAVRSTPLMERLRSCSARDLLPVSLIRKLICYCRKHVRSRLSTQAARVLQEFYLEIRTRSTHTPVSLRQLESLVRLSQVIPSMQELG